MDYSQLDVQAAYSHLGIFRFSCCPWKTQNSAEFAPNSQNDIEFSCKDNSVVDNLKKKKKVLASKKYNSSNNVGISLSQFKSPSRCWGSGES